MANADLPEEELELAGALRERGWSDTVQVANDTFAVLRAGLAGPLAGIGQESDGAGNQVLAAHPLADGASPPRADGPGQWGVARHLRRRDQLRGRIARRPRPPVTSRWAG